MGIKEILELAVFAASLAQKLLNEGREPTKEELDGLESRLDSHASALRRAAGRD